MIDLYIYQTVHLAGGRARLVAEHAAVLDTAARAVFGSSYKPDIRALTTRIEVAAAAERYSKEWSCFVRIELTAGGEERFIPAGTSLYDGYALRSLTPDAACVFYDLPFSDAHTSARDAAAQLAAVQALRCGNDIAVRCSSEGVALTADDAPLFAIKNKLVTTSPAEASVERDLAVRAARAAGFEVEERAIMFEELSRFDELFYADHRGITSLAHCDSLAYMSLAAERIAAAMEGLFSK